VSVKTGPFWERAILRHKKRLTKQSFRFSRLKLHAQGTVVRRCTGTVGPAIDCLSVTVSLYNAGLSLHEQQDRSLYSDSILHKFASASAAFDYRLPHSVPLTSQSCRHIIPCTVLYKVFFISSGPWHDYRLRGQCPMISQ